MIQQRLLQLLAFAGSSVVVWAYVVTVPNVVPVGRQMKFLKELTSDLVSAAPGQLSNQQIAISHDLMYAWSRHPQTSRSRSHSLSGSAGNSGGSSAAQKKECALQVQLLLKRVIDERQAGNMIAALDTSDYNCLLEGWARSGLGEVSALRTEQILEAMQASGDASTRPNLSSFKACLMAWRLADVPHAAVRAHRILDWMLDLSRQHRHVRPDADCFDLVLQLWSRSRQEQAPRQAERLLATMEQWHRETNDARLKPRSSSFNAVLSTWAKASSVSSSATPTAIFDRSWHILNVMEALGETDATVAPDTVSYNIVMSILAKPTEPTVLSSAASHADMVLRHIVRVVKYQQDMVATNSDETSRHPIITMETILFNIAIGLYAKSGTTRSYRKARSILDRHLALVDEYGTGVVQPPDIVSWTSVLSCCAAECGPAVEKEKAFQVAIGTYRQLQAFRTMESPLPVGSRSSRVQPNHVTYGTMLKVCARLHPIRSTLRQKWVTHVFTDAVAAGCVGDMVVAKLREAATHDVYKQLMQGYTRTTLPEAWTCNVCEQSEFRYKQAKQRGKRAEV